MSTQAAHYKISVFALLLTRNHAGRPAMLVKLQSDQVEGRKKAGLSPESDVLIVDLPGVRILPSDAPLVPTLLNKVKEETGCDAELINSSVGLYELIDQNGMSERDLAIGYPMRLIGELKEKDNYRWVTYDVLISDTVVRFAGMGKKSRRYLLAVDCLKRFPPSKPKHPAHDSKEFSMAEAT